MLKNLKSSSLILTTHRMDEAEGLCDNIAIMINGGFVVYGTPSHLKSEYGQGYSIVLTHTHPLDSLGDILPYLKLISSSTTDDSPLENGPSITSSTFQSSSDSIVLSHTLKALCHLKFEMKTIKDFTITRSSLEQVFMKFAKH